MIGKNEAGPEEMRISEEVQRGKTYEEIATARRAQMPPEAEVWREVFSKKYSGPQIVGLYGESRAGKDETAAILIDAFEYEQRAQAAAIREILLGLNPLIVTNDGDIISMQKLFNQCGHNWDNVKAHSRESTDYMIRLGQTCRDVLGINVWLNTAFPPIESTVKVVISDIRQVNEYEAVKERGGEIWKITRPGTEKRDMDGLLDHLTFDAHIHNDGTLEDLRGFVVAQITKEQRGTE